MMFPPNPDFLFSLVGRIASQRSISNVAMMGSSELGDVARNLNQDHPPLLSQTHYFPVRPHVNVAEQRSQRKNRGS